MLLRDQKIRTNELNFERKEKMAQKFMLVLMGLALALVITACNDEKTAGAVRLKNAIRMLDGCDVAIVIFDHFD